MFPKSPSGFRAPLTVRSNTGRHPPSRSPTSSASTELRLARHGTGPSESSAQSGVLASPCASSPVRALSCCESLDSPETCPALCSPWYPLSADVGSQPLPADHAHPLLSARRCTWPHSAHRHPGEMRCRFQARRPIRGESLERWLARTLGAPTDPGLRP